MKAEDIHHEVHGEHRPAWAGRGQAKKFGRHGSDMAGAEFILQLRELTEKELGVVMEFLNTTRATYENGAELFIDTTPTGFLLRLEFWERRLASGWDARAMQQVVDLVLIAMRGNVYRENNVHAYLRELKAFTLKELTNLLLSIDSNHHVSGDLGRILRTVRGDVRREAERKARDFYEGSGERARGQGGAWLERACNAYQSFGEKWIDAPAPSEQ